MVEIIRINDKCYPLMLREIDSCPDKLFIRGNPEILGGNKMVAVVGSRELDDYAKRIIEKMVEGLVEAGWIIVSGLAFGVDALVAKEAIKYGGKTVAVIPGGVDEARPKANREIFELIIKNGGAVVSEDENGRVVNRESFLRRNRIVAGMARGIVVISGKKRSGTLNTAAWAGRWGREVMAVPGRADEPLSAAPNWLIKNGAAMVESLSDVLEVLVD